LLRKLPISSDGLGLTTELLSRLPDETTNLDVTSAMTSPGRFFLTIRTQELVQQSESHDARDMTQKIKADQIATPALKNLEVANRIEFYTNALAGGDASNKARACQSVQNQIRLWWCLIL
jgi:hypothetical protein